MDEWRNVSEHRIKTKDSLYLHNLFNYFDPPNADNLLPGILKPRIIWILLLDGIEITFKFSFIFYKMKSAFFAKPLLLINWIILHDSMNSNEIWMNIIQKYIFQIISIMYILINKTNVPIGYQFVNWLIQSDSFHFMKSLCDSY